MPRTNKHLMIAAGGAAIMAFALLLNVLSGSSLRQLAGRASERIAQKASRANDLLNELLVSGRPAVFEKYTREFSRNSIALYLFRNDSLIAWNNAQLPFNDIRSLPVDPSGISELPFGYSFYAKKQKDALTAVAIMLIKPRHELQNRYLSNEFVKWTGLPEGIQVKEHGIPVLLGSTPLFYIGSTEARYTTRLTDDLCFALFLAGFLVSLVAAIQLLRLGHTRLSIFVFLSAFLLRLLMISLKWPEFVYNGTHYDVRVFGNADSFFNGYLGDILFNALFLAAIAAASRYLAPSTGRVQSLVRLTLLSALFVVVVYVLNGCLASLVTNSTLNFNFLEFMNLSAPVFVALVAVAFLCTAVFLLLRSLVRLTQSFNYSFAWYLLLLVSCSMIVFFADARRPVLPDVIWIPAAGLLVYGTLKWKRTGMATSFALFLLVMSAFTSAILSRYMLLNESRNLEVLTVKLGERQDPVLENEFLAIKSAAASDRQLSNLVQLLPESSEAVRDLVNSRYFGGYFKRYMIEYSLFDRDCHPLLRTNDPLLLNEGYFTDQIRLHADSVSPGLHFVSDYRKNSRYIGLIHLRDFRLYLLMEPKQFEELGSFPDLLLDESQQRHEKLTGFSYAVYRAGQNTSSFGSLNYPPFLPDSVLLARAEPEQVHWHFKQDDYTTIVVSRPERTWAYFFTFNSYLLLLFSVVGYVIYTFHSLLFTEQFARSSLTRRIQTIIIALLLVAMSAVGYTSATLVRSQFSAENRKELREKTEIIFTDLSRVFTPGQLFDPTNREAVHTRLNEYSRLFNTDVSLFNANGFLYATSQPRLYSLGLAARHAHPEAIHRLSANQSAAVTIRERAGKLSYTSLYTALYAPGTSQPAGYINLPYFARQTDLVAELSGIVNGLVNVYVLLFVISIFAGLVLAGYITRPLRLVQEQIARISLGRSNQKIEWEGSDELGRLIAEYNQMLVKLEESATLLAQSERESAWREMAKQVAHEIKNPLTPMKLNLQYLQRLAESDPGAFREKFEKASAGIIEQIDTLASIANEFSHFAKLPVSQVQAVNIVEVVNTALTLFENRGQVNIRNRIPEEQLLVKADREQCLRIFNNLFANAVQALAETSDPWIEIGRQLHPGKVVILVRDNGCGIDDEMKPRIFTPNFTTKTTGSGLGLAMVKNIVEGFGGKIWFSSEKGLGTIFYLEFVRDSD